MISTTIKKWLFPPFEIEKKRLQEAAINVFEELPSRKSVKSTILSGLIRVNDKVGITSTWVKIGDEISYDFTPLKLETLQKSKK